MKNILLLFTVLCLLSKALYGNSYSLTPLGKMESGFIPLSINEKHQIVGYADVYDPEYDTNVQHAFLWENDNLYDLGDLPGGDYCYGSRANSINNSGVIVGNGTVSYQYSPSPHMVKIFNDASMGFTYVNNTLIGMDDYSNGPKSSTAVSINNTGLVVGRIFGDAQQNDYTVYTTHYNSTVDQGTLLPITNGIPNALNDSGNIVGYQKSNDISSIEQPFYWSSQENMLYQLESVIGYGEATDINNNNYTCGNVLDFYMTEDSKRHVTIKAAIWKDDKSLVVLDELDDSGLVYKEAFAINDSDIAVGYEAESGLLSNGYAVIWQNYKAICLQDMLDSTGNDWQLFAALDINNNGDIVGYGYNPNGEIEGFLLTPVPEPSALLFLGIGGIFWRLRNKLCKLSN